MTATTIPQIPGDDEIKAGLNLEELVSYFLLTVALRLPAEALKVPALWRSSGAMLEGKSLRTAHL